MRRSGLDRYELVIALHLPSPKGHKTVPIARYGSQISDVKLIKDRAGPLAAGKRRQRRPTVGHGRHPEVRAAFGAPRRMLFRGDVLVAILRGTQERAPQDDAN